MPLSRLNDAVVWDNGKVYFFGDHDQYLRYDLATDRADPGYPKPISETWVGWPWHEAPTGAVEWSEGKACFFYGYSYSCYDLAENRVDPGYPRPIEDLWPGMFTADVQAAVNWGDGNAYFFSGSSYVRLDIGAARVAPGFPRAIQARLAGFVGRPHDLLGVQLGQRQGLLLPGSGPPVLALGHRRRTARSGLPQGDSG